MSTIMVRMDDERWTTDAVHLACTLARNMNVDVTLVRLMYVQHASWLGTEFGDTPPTAQEQEAIREYLAVAEKYGVKLNVQSMQCVSLTDALVQAADYLDAGIVFARVPQGRISLLHRFERWNLKRQLSARNCQLHTLEQPVDSPAWLQPSVTVQASR